MRSRKSPLRPSPVLLSFVSIAAGLALAPALTACQRDTSTTSLTSATPAASATTAHTLIPDDDMTRAITKHLAEDVALHAEHVGVTVTNGIATLTGPVSNLLAKERAAQVAETLRGVRAVIDRVDVKPVVRTDDQIKADVTKAFQSDSVTRMHTTGVAVKDGKVSLTGTAASWPEKGLFTQITKAVKGVKAVDNAIAVKYPLEPSAFRPDEEVAKGVKARDKQTRTGFRSVHDPPTRAMNEPFGLQHW